ncbi:TAT-variant-translocated molybdopterin oxidoreductase [Candidatus Binatia bacterium]|nr:TAT-variant-translocated molybdopterin oxidoreductase [Candidatus Binatia bacterium]
MSEPTEPSVGSAGPRLDVAAVRARLAGTTGRQYWRGLEEIAETAEFEEFLKAEFPREAAVFERVGRREFLKLMGASMALAGLSACTRQPQEQLVPYVKMPEQIVPGVPVYYATAMPMAGFGTGLLIESHMGRPTKAEGNPDHPASLGATDVMAQASILGLYDPDRSQVVRYLNEIRPFAAFSETVRQAIDAERASGGAGVRILTGTVTSPALAHELTQLLADLPKAQWHQYEAVSRDNIRAGTVLAFGTPLNVVYRIDKADVIVALDADILGAGPGKLNYARAFARRRQVADPKAAMNRLYVAENTPSITGSKADHRLPVRASEIETLARTLAGALRGQVPSGPHSAWVAAVAKDLLKHRGTSVVVAGDQQPAAVHALAHTMNNMLGNAGATVVYTDPVEAQSVDQIESLRTLSADMEAGQVNLLLMLGVNPVYDAPVDVEFAKRMQKVALRAHLGLYVDETAELCHWHVPEAHYLEAWGDVRGFDGTASIVQPLIAPLYEGKSALEVVIAVGPNPGRPAYDAVREYWKAQGLGGDGDFDNAWRQALNDGVIPNTTAAARATTLKGTGLPPGKATDPQTLELVFRADASVYDGRFANLGWLQESPRPLTKLTWDNVAHVSPATAERLQLASEDVVELDYKGRVVQAPVWVQPGHADNSVTIELGYGRRRGGRVADGLGFDAYRLRTAEAPWFAGGLEILKVSARYPLATTQTHHSMEGRDLVRVATIGAYRADPEHAFHGHHHEPGPEESFYPPWPYDGYKWGMTIDLNACIGCGACEIACQAENNIAVVGKEQVLIGREMHWIRVDRYYAGDLDNPEILHQPVPCMQCELAPCEVVCPVQATVHGHEGLNDMVYNRCVGTRYCGNNCPYKVRRFNFGLFTDWTTESFKPMRNPDVTVRSRGVMEKCTYCVQRINHARIVAKREDRRIRDGEVVSACQQVCPTEAIVFGDLNDKNSRVAKTVAEPRNYGLLAELGTQPRTTYLADIRNPNPELAARAGGPADPHRTGSNHG